MFIPDFQLHPTFSERPPTNGVKTRLVKMCSGQHAAADLLLGVKITLRGNGISTFLEFLESNVAHGFHTK